MVVLSLPGMPSKRRPSAKSSALPLMLSHAVYHAHNFVTASQVQGCSILSVLFWLSRKVSFPYRSTVRSLIPITALLASCAAEHWNRKPVHMDSSSIARTHHDP